METNAKNYSVVFLGDSFTNRTGVKFSEKPEKKYSTSYVGNYTEFVEKRLWINRLDKNFCFYNFGKSGDCVVDVLNRVEKDFKGLKPDVVVLLIGHNDVKKNDLGNFIVKYRMLVDVLKSKSIKILGLSILPLINHIELDSKVEQFNKAIRDELIEQDMDYLDLYSIFLNIIRFSNKSIPLFEETNHLSELGNILISDRVYDYLNNYLWG